MATGSVFTGGRTGFSGREKCQMSIPAIASRGMNAAIFHPLRRRLRPELTVVQETAAVPNAVAMAFRINF